MASEGEVAEEDEGEVDDVGAAKRAVRRTQGSLASMSGAGGLVRLLQHTVKYVHPCNELSSAACDRPVHPAHRQHGSL